MGRSITRIAAIASKEFIHISRDWRMIVAVLVTVVDLAMDAWAHP